MKTLEQYLKESCERGVVDHALRADVDDLGRVTFYIHPDSRDGETCDFIVAGDRIEVRGEVLV